MKNLLLFRNHSGLGDWIMAMTLIKLINKFYPSFKTYLRVTDKHECEFPKIIKQVYNNFDCRIDHYVTNNMIKNINFDYISDHLVYDRRNLETNFVESMVDIFNINTGLKVQFISNFYSKFNRESIEVEVPDKYILIQSGGKRQFKTKTGKDWGFNNFQQLGSNLIKNYKLVQIGGKDDKKLPCCEYHYLGVDLGVIDFLMKNCESFIGISDGLSVYAGHHDIKSFIIYCNDRDIERNKYENQIQLTNDDPVKIYKKIKEKLVC